MPIYDLPDELANIDGEQVDFEEVEVTDPAVDGGHVDMVWLEGYDETGRKWEIEGARIGPLGYGEQYEFYDETLERME